MLPKADFPHLGVPGFGVALQAGDALGSVAPGSVPSDGIGNSLVPLRMLSGLERIIASLPRHPGYQAGTATHLPTPLTAKQRLDRVFNIVSTVYLSYFKSFPRLHHAQWGKGRLMCPGGHLLCVCRAPRCGRRCCWCAGSTGRLLGLTQE